MKVGITLASGQLGGAILKETINLAGIENTIAIARSPEKINQPGVETRPADLDNQETCKIAFQGLDVVLLVSSNSHPNVRLLQHTNAIDGAKAAGVGRMVFISIVGANNINPNAIQKVAADTEEYLKNSGLEWTIGRNGLYIEPDLEYLPNYIQEGKISNCAADGKCSYTSRNELAFAYAKLVTGNNHAGKIYNLAGEAITQQELVNYLNDFYQINLVYECVDAAAYRQERIIHLGDTIGNIIADIYESISKGEFQMESNFLEVTGRPHKTIMEILPDFPIDSPKEN
jgi:NAD(P)H dehydrogenase (quinone)